MTIITAVLIGDTLGCVLGMAAGLFLVKLMERSVGRR